MRILVTGSDGFIGKNLCVRLAESQRYEFLTFRRGDSIEKLNDLVSNADGIIHLAGVNRSVALTDFTESNVTLTMHLCDSIKSSGRHIPLIIASSIHADLNSPYGVSKKAAEEVARDLAKSTNNPVGICRLPNVFGKWCRPNYNSVVATFCYNIANNLPIEICNPQKKIKLAYIDDVVEVFCQVIKLLPGTTEITIKPVYEITLGELAEQIQAFSNCRSSLYIERVGGGLTRGLYSTYVSYLPPAKFLYHLPKYSDERGDFVEILKTKDSGQFSFLTARPGVTRGAHYHHTKTEKFLVIKGRARFGFRNVISNEKYEIMTIGEVPQIVETIPGWTHDITNVGQDDLIVLIWASEVFDRGRPDTIASKV